MIELSIYSIYSPDRVRAYELGKKKYGLGGSQGARNIHIILHHIEDQGKNINISYDVHIKTKIRENCMEINSLHGIERKIFKHYNVQYLLELE